MDYTQQITQVKDVLDKAKDVIIVTHERPTADSIGASLALYLGLTSLGKKVVIACPEPMTVELSSFVGVNKISQEISKKNFVISLDYQEGSIEKVSYNIEGNKFNLVIEPREGYDTFSKDKVSFTNAGTTADVIVAVDTIHLGGLKKLYESEKELYASKPVINIDRHPNNVAYGQVNVIDSQASSTAEVVYQLMTGLGVTISPDMATNLLNAVYSATNNFTSATVTSDAFELAANCVKIGGKRFRRVNPQQQTVSEELPTGEKATTETTQQSIVKEPQLMEQKIETHVTPIQLPPQPKKMQEAPADWLKPKIFKSSNLG